MIAPLDDAIISTTDGETFGADQNANEVQRARIEREQLAREQLYREVQTIAADVFRLRPRITPLEWGEANYELPESSAIKGKFRVAEMPFLRPIFDALANPRVRRIVVAKGSQLAVTTVAQVWAGWTMEHSPAAMLSVWPGEKLLKRFVLTRINPMLEQVPSLKTIFSRSGLRESGDSIAHKEFPGGTFDMMNANSTNDVRSITAERAHLSEIDELSADLGDQGDSLDLVRRALRTFRHTSKEFLECTPTRYGASKVWDELALSSWHEWHVPCPHCEFLQVMRWAPEPNGVDEDPAATLYQEEVARKETRARRLNFTYDLDSYGAVEPGSTHYVCVECATIVPQSSLKAMNAAGTAIARYPERKTVFGLHLPSWLTPHQSWDELAASYEKGKRSTASRKVFVNTIAGLPYKEVFAQPEAHFLQARAEVYDAPVPTGVRVLTAGGDLGKDSVELTVWGWGAGEEQWLIAWERIEGDPAQPETWQKVAQFLNQSWTDAYGDAHWIRAVALDAGYLGEHVKRFCGAWRSPAGTRAIHVIGKDGRTRQIIEQPGADVKKRRRSKRPSWIVGDETIKDLLYARMRITTPGPEFIHTPVGIDKAFYLQLTAEVQKTVRVNGHPVRKWTLPEDRRNEALDTTKYAYAALHTLGRRLIQQLAKLATLPPEKRAPLRRKKRAPEAEPEHGKAAAPVAAVSPASGARRKRRGMISKGIQ